MSRENKYMKILAECEKPYENKIIDILNNAKMEVQRCGDMYNREAAPKYQREVIKKAVKDVDNIRQAYLRDVADKLDGEAAKLKVPKSNNKSNAEKLLDSIEELKRIELMKMQYSVLNNQDLIAIGRDTEDNIELTVVKSMLMDRANKITDKEQFEVKKDLELNAKTLTGYTAEVQIEEMKQIFSVMIQDNSMLPGIPVGTALAIGSDVEAYLSKGTEIESEI